MHHIRVRFICMRVMFHTVQALNVSALRHVPCFLQLSLRTKLRNNKPGKPTLGLTINRDVEYRQVISLTCTSLRAVPGNRAHETYSQPAAVPDVPADGMPADFMLCCASLSHVLPAAALLRAYLIMGCGRWSLHARQTRLRLCVLQITPSKAAPPKQPTIPVDRIKLNPTTDMSLDDKLQALDAIHAKAFAEKGKVKEGGVEVATFTRK